MIHEELWKQLAAQDPADVCRRSLATWREGTGAYHLPVLNAHYLISTGERTVANEAAADEKPNMWLWLSAVQYLINAKDIAVSGDPRKAEQFDGGGIFFRHTHAIPTASLEAKFGDDGAAFHRAAATLGGTPLDHKDISYEFALFPRFPVTVILWLADEEFPARASMLFDSTANQHLAPDAIWSAAKFIEGRLLKAAD